MPKSAASLKSTHLWVLRIPRSVNRFGAFNTIMKRANSGTASGRKTNTWAKQATSIVSAITKSDCPVFGPCLIK
jgi:hypothetical protein